MQKFLNNVYTLVLMKLRTPFIACMYIVVTLASCASPHKMILLQDKRADNARVQEVVKSLKMQESTYKLRPADRVMLNLVSLTDERVNFIKEPEMELVVDNKGQLELPVIGLVEVGGLTIREAEEKIKRTASDFLKTPTVRLKLLNFTFTVLGEVAGQGSFIAPEPKVNILQALGQAGGFTENANREKIR
ncbi:MAG TPA: polysaccharide biosynthesis/export family protein, partial [Chitinophagaceae bacterium]|nr:polysaccharide biosynthesis/export family protein [Chitinophagaceae bacterium]